MLKRGLFISFEGIDGCGKSTQTRLVGEYFASQNQPYLLTREPGGDTLSEGLRELLLKTNGESWEAESEMLLFLAARLQHWRRVILPAIQNGTHVICDRFLDSSRVYQGIASGLGVNFYDNLHRMVMGNNKPNLTFLLDLPASKGIERTKLRGGSGDYFEQKELDFHEKLRNGFVQLAANEPQRIIKIDASQPPEIVHNQILSHLKSWQN
jgi:dTMP kinase